jgi:hypothetical protein
MSALAIAILCFYPPDKFITLEEPMKVFKFLSRSYAKRALALVIANLISSSVASYFPMRRFSLMVPMTRTGS